MSEIVTIIKSELLDMANLVMDRNFFGEATSRIQGILRSTECSLWSINRNITDELETADEKIPISTSLLYRVVNEIGKEDSLSNKEDFVHDLKEKGFFNIVMEDTHKVYYRFGRREVEKYGHRSMHFVHTYKLDDFIVIPVCDYNEKDKIIAVLELSYKNGENTILEEEWKEIAHITNSFFSSAFHRYLIFQEQALIEKLISTQDKYRDGSVSSFFDHIIEKVFRLFFDYQASSVFIWDSYHMRYNLVSTTDKSIDVNDSIYSYGKGIGSTGRVGESGRPYISDKCNHNYQWYENMEYSPHTVMIVPILNPSNPKDAIGIIRFLNKKNPFKTEFIDYFNDVDLKLVEFATKYLSLVIDFYNKKKEQTHFISKLTHEFNTPANSIYKSVDRLLNNIEDDVFLERYLRPYLENIKYFAELQRWQAKSTLYLTQSGKRKYEKKRCSLPDIIRKSIDVVRPIAREYGVLFENIKLNTYNIQNPIINVDEDAFVTVFYNLLTNAIKYHDRNNPNSFLVSISCYESETNYRIEVSDWGIGISPNDSKSVFQIGYRGERAIRENASGFGVGLSVAKQIVEDYDGSILVKHFQRPTIFEITFPKRSIL